MFLFRIIVHPPLDFKLSYSWRLVRFQSSLVMTYLLLELMLLTFRYLDWSTSLGFSPFTLTCACWNYVWEILLFLVFESLYLVLCWSGSRFLSSFGVERRNFLLPWYLSIFLLDELDQKRKVFLFSSLSFFFWKGGRLFFLSSWCLMILFRWFWS